jgi:flagellar basal-body rod modification protein FlgD
MSTTGSVNSGVSAGSASGSGSSSSTSALTNITPNDFLQMLITQLKNQDPVNPTSSDQILQQISQIDNIEATVKLSSSLTSVATDQGFQTASGLIGKKVQGVDGSGNPVSGTVSSVSFANGAASLNVGNQTMQLSGISSISDPSSPSSGTNLSNLTNALSGN